MREIIIDEEVKPCPFCGHKASWKLTKKKHCQLHGNEYQDNILGCFSPRCEMKPSITANRISMCVEEWNNRPQEKELKEVVKTIKLMYEKETTKKLIDRIN